MTATAAIRLKSAFAVAQARFRGTAMTGPRLSLSTAFEAHT